MYKLELTEQEASALCVLIDMAVKTGGIQVAETGVVLVKKIQSSKVKEDESEDVTS